MKSEAVHIRLDPKLKAQYQQHCDSMSVSLSEWVLLACAEAWGRQQYFRKVKEMQAELARAEPVAPVIAPEPADPD